MVLLSVQFVNCNAMKKILSILHILSIVSTILLTQSRNRKIAFQSDFSCTSQKKTLILQHEKNI